MAGSDEILNKSSDNPPAEDDKKEVVTHFIQPHDSVMVVKWEFNIDK